MREIYWRALEGIAKVAPFIAAATAVLLFWLAVTLCVIGVSALADGYWSVGF